MGPQLLPWHSQCQGSARAQAPNGEVRGGYPADCIAPASPDHNTKVKKSVSSPANCRARIYSCRALEPMENQKIDLNVLFLFSKFTAVHFFVLCYQKTAVLTCKL